MATATGADPQIPSQETECDFFLYFAKFGQGGSAESQMTLMQSSRSVDVPLADM